MTKTEALHKFWSGFGIPFFASGSVPTGTQAPSMPYGTYEVRTSAFGGSSVAAAVNLWYRTTRNVEPNAKAEEISKAIGYSGVTIDCDDGIIWIKRGDPWCTATTDNSENTVKRRILNVMYDFITM